MEIFNAPESGIEPGPGDVSLVEGLGAFDALVNETEHIIGRLIKDLREIIMTAGGPLGNLFSWQEPPRDDWRP